MQHDLTIGSDDGMDGAAVERDAVPAPGACGIDLARELVQSRPLEGMHVGALTLEERLVFGRLRAAGLARAEYTCAGGFLGLGKVRLVQDACAAVRDAG